MRKRVTEIMPWLKPLRITQRKFFFYTKMRFDKNKYSKLKGQLLPNTVYVVKNPMINTESGYDIKYQYNKMHNLKLASEPIHKLYINPGETFSIYQLLREVDSSQYLDGLIVVNGKMSADKGGGLCQISNILFELFLHSDLTIVERHPHAKEYILPKEGELIGIDATIVEGWKDLKVKNETPYTYQITIEFDSDNIICSLLSTQESPPKYQIINENLKEVVYPDHIRQEVDVYKVDERNQKHFLYHNVCDVMVSSNE